MAKTRRDPKLCQEFYEEIAWVYWGLAIAQRHLANVAKLTLGTRRRLRAVPARRKAA